MTWEEFYSWASKFTKGRYIQNSPTRIMLGNLDFIKTGDITFMDYRGESHCVAIKRTPGQMKTIITALTETKE